MFPIIVKRTWESFCDKLLNRFSDISGPNCFAAVAGAIEKNKVTLRQWLTVYVHTAWIWTLKIPIHRTFLSVDFLFLRESSGRSLNGTLLGRSQLNRKAPLRLPKWLRAKSHFLRCRRLKYIARHFRNSWLNSSFSMFSRIRFFSTQKGEFGKPNKIEISIHGLKS